MNNVVKNGLILGGLSTVFLFVVYMVDITTLGNKEVIIPSLIISIGLYFFFAFQMRKEQGGFMTFKQAFMAVFMMLMVAGVVSTTFKTLLYNVIDTEIAEDVKRSTIEQTESIYESFGIADKEESIQALADLEEKDFSMTPTNIGIELGVIVVFNLIFALIIGVIVKKNPPLNFVKEDGMDDGAYDDI
jgi:hypothetical protein